MEASKAQMSIDAPISSLNSLVLAQSSFGMFGGDNKEAHFMGFLGPVHFIP